MNIVHHVQTHQISIRV